MDSLGQFNRIKVCKRFWDISVEIMMPAELENLIRLANFLGIETEHLKNKPGAKWLICCAIARFNKRNPQLKIKG
jgi:hypothetical protein